jgi:hypothetical protein
MLPSSPTAECARPRAPRRAIASSRLWVGLLVTTAWLAMMTLVVRHERERSGATLRRMGVSPEVLLVSWTDYDSWMWIEQGSRRVGLTRLLIVANPVDAPGRTSEREDRPRGTGIGPVEPPPREPGYTMMAQTRLNLPLSVRLYFQVGMNRAFEMQTIQATFDVLGRTWRLEGFVEGLALYYRVSAPAAAFAGGEQIGMATLTEPRLLGDTVVPIVMRSDAFEVGRRWRMPVAMPFSGGMNLVMDVEVQGRDTIQLGGMAVEAWKLSERVGAIETTAWYDEHARLLRREMGRGLRLEKAEPAAALGFDPAMRQMPDLPPIDRSYLKAHVDPDLRGKPLQDLLPQLPIFE